MATARSCDPRWSLSKKPELMLFKSRAFVGRRRGHTQRAR